MNHNLILEIPSARFYPEVRMVCGVGSCRNEVHKEGLCFGHWGSQRQEFKRWKMCRIRAGFRLCLRKMWGNK